jgi:hypothetical protein
MSMKSVVSAGVLFLLLGTIVPAYAQHEKKEEGKPQQEKKAEGRPQQEQHKPEKPAQASRGPSAKPAPPRQAQPARRPAPRSQPNYGGTYHGGVRSAEPTYGGVHPSGVPQHQEQVRSGFAQSRAKSWETEHRSWRQRGGYNGYRVPDERFRLYFGGNHFFRISRLPMVYVGGYPRFQYDGYWVTFVDPWPESWSPDWYDTDDVYIDYTDDGYYLL